MKKTVATTLCLMALGAIALADVYVKVTTHTDAYYTGGVPHPATDRTTEIWMCQNRLATITPARHLIVDEPAKTLTIVFPGEKTYLVAPLPLEMNKLVDEAVYPMLQAYQTLGTVAAGSKTDRIGPWECRSYTAEVSGPTPLEITFWCTAGVPFDWRRMDRLQLPMRRLANYSEEYIRALEMVQGIPVLTEVTVFLQGMSFNSTSRVVEIEEKPAPPTVYTVPEDFTRKDRLSIEDLRRR